MVNRFVPQFRDNGHSSEKQAIYDCFHCHKEFMGQVLCVSYGRTRQSRQGHRLDDPPCKYGGDGSAHCAVMSVWADYRNDISWLLQVPWRGYPIDPQNYELLEHEHTAMVSCKH